MRKTSMWTAIYKPFPLADGRIMWERVQVDCVANYKHVTYGIAKLITDWNADARLTHVQFQRGGIWVRLLSSSPRPPRFFFREELPIWPKTPGEREVIPDWELRL